MVLGQLTAKKNYGLMETKSPSPALETKGADTRDSTEMGTYLWKTPAGSYGRIPPKGGRHPRIQSVYKTPSRTWTLIVDPGLKCR